MDAEAEGQRTDNPDEFLRGLVAGVVLTCLAVLIVGGSVLLGLR